MWKSSAFAERYIDNSMKNKKDIGSMYCKMINLPHNNLSNSSDNVSPKNRAIDAENNLSLKRQKN